MVFKWCAFIEDSAEYFTKGNLKNIFGCELQSQHGWIQQYLTIPYRLHCPVILIKAWLLQYFFSFPKHFDFMLMLFSCFKKTFLNSLWKLFMRTILKKIFVKMVMSLRFLHYLKYILNFFYVHLKCFCILNQKALWMCELYFAGYC